jgi:hypothetical protein
MLRIEINCEPYEVDEHLKELGFMRRPFTGAENQPGLGVQGVGTGPAPNWSPIGSAAFANGEQQGPSGIIAPSAASRAVSTFTDEMTALERPDDLKASAAPEAPAGAARVRGQPAPGRKRRTAAEVAQDLEYAQTDRPAQVPSSISTGENRVNPEDEAQDAADEAAESAQRAPGPPTMDDLRAAVKRYSDKFGPEAAIANVRGILGSPMLEVAPAGIPSAIAKIDLATSGSTVLGVGGDPNPSAPETSLFDDGAPRVAKREDIIAAMTAYCVRFDGTNDPNKAPNGQADLPRILEKACGHPRISLLPQTPESFGAAVTAIEQATKNNPFGRAVRQ